jgi:hypothetical protein
MRLISLTAKNICKNSHPIQTIAKMKLKDLARAMKSINARLSAANTPTQLQHRDPDRLLGAIKPH